MSPGVGRRNGLKRREDESQLILNSPNSDSEANSIVNGNLYSQPSSECVGFVFPNVKLKTKPVSQVRKFSSDRPIPLFSLSPETDSEWKVKHRNCNRNR